MSSVTCDSPALENSGLKCPTCEYDLTGLPESRCPECGVPFTWNRVAEFWNRQPTIVFERESGPRKASGFVVTWLTVLFMPWRFARQIVHRCSLIHGLSFLAICLASIGIPSLIDGDADIWKVWSATAIVYIVLQTVGFTLIDWPHWRRPIRSLRFWFIVGCYTSAIMITEVFLGPVFVPVPILEAADWRAVLQFSVLEWIQFTVECGQLVVWIAGLACCFYYRMRGSGTRRWTCLALLALVIPGIFALYAWTINDVCDWIIDVLDVSFF